MDSRIKIREIKSSEIIHLDTFLHDAIFIPKGVEKPDKVIIKLPELKRYISDFGKETDLCLVAELNGKLIGAIWTRIFTEAEKGFGYVDSKTPELSMSVNVDYRQKGIGTNLLKDMLYRLTRLDYEQISLSVEKLNYAYRLYQKFGFKTIKEDKKSATMIKKVRNGSPQHTVYKIPGSQ